MIQTLAAYRFNQTIERISSILHLPLHELAAGANLEVVDLKREMSSVSGPTVTTIFALSRFLNIPADDLITGTIDPADLQERYFSQSLPSRYRVAAGSRFRTSAPTLHWLRNYWGNDACNGAFRVLGIRQSHVQSPEQLVSINLPVDLFSFVKKRGFTDEDIIEIGFNSVQVPENQPVAAAYSSARNQLEQFLYLCEEVSPLYEVNFKYILRKATRNGVTIMFRPHPEIIDAFASQAIGSHELCQYRLGALMAQPRFLGLPPAKVVKRACVHRGDSQCIYDVRWDEPATQGLIRGYGKARSRLRALPSSDTPPRPDEGPVVGAATALSSFSLSWYFRAQSSPSHASVLLA